MPILGTDQFLERALNPGGPRVCPACHNTVSQVCPHNSDDDATKCLQMQGWSRTRNGKTLQCRRCHWQPQHCTLYDRPQTCIANGHCNLIQPDPVIQDRDKQMLREQLSPLIMNILNSHIMFYCILQVKSKRKMRSWNLTATGCERFATLDMSRKCEDNMNVYWIELLWSMPQVLARIGNPAPKLMATWVEAFVRLTTAIVTGGAHFHIGCGLGSSIKVNLYNCKCPRWKR